MGPSGSGKTTLLNILGGLDRPRRARSSVDGVEITTKSRKALAEWRARHVGLVFQAYNLIPVLTALRRTSSCRCSSRRSTRPSAANASRPRSASSASRTA